jgi:MoaA/NifB/PqqE/SkfB family radical SAM enzyme
VITKLKIFADYRCNLACSYCVQNAGRRRGPLAMPVLPPERRGDVALDALAAFLGDAQRTAEKISVYLSGGEPLASRPWFRMARLIRDLDMPYKTISNGTLLEQKIDELLEVRPDWISFTFNGTGARHDHVVGVPGAFAAMWRGLRRNVRRMFDAGIHVEATYVMTERSYRQITSDLQTISNIPFRKVVLQHLSYLEPEICEGHRKVYRRLFGNNSDFIFGEETPVPDFDLKVMHAQIQRTLAARWPFAIDVYPPLTELDELTDYYSSQPQFYRQRHCLRFDEEIWVLPDGRITSCFHETFGNLATHSFQDIVCSERRRWWSQTMRGLDESLPGCRRCHRIHTFPRAGRSMVAPAGR